MSYEVALIGDATADTSSGIMLTRLLEWAGFDQRGFCAPAQAKVIVPLGPVAWSSITHQPTTPGQFLNIRGYVDGRLHGQHLLPTIHPSFIIAGQSRYSRAFINDIQKAVELAQRGLPPQPLDYLLDPSPLAAYEWAKAYRRELVKEPRTRLAFDIETPGKGDDEGELSEDDDPTYHIHRIGFSYRGYSGLSIPWEPSYQAAIRTCMESSGEKVVWNAGFDVPRIESGGVRVRGLVHDGMVAWHILHSDLPKGLGFVATFTCPWTPAWKHLSHAKPAFYNCTDADVELRSMEWIEQALREAGLWSVYQEDVVELDPVLKSMSAAGMPIDEEIRYDRALQLSHRLTDRLHDIEQLVPTTARRIQPPMGFVRDPTDTAGLVSITVDVLVRRCAGCGIRDPKKVHFLVRSIRSKRPPNLCANAVVVEQVESVSRFARLKVFKPSREQLMRYQAVMNRPVPTQYDKKTRARKPTMNEKAIKTLMGRYPEDSIYAHILDYRSLNQIAGLYIGRPE